MQSDSSVLLAHDFDGSRLDKRIWISACVKRAFGEYLSLPGKRNGRFLNPVAPQDAITEFDFACMLKAFHAHYVPGRAYVTLSLCRKHWSAVRASMLDDDVVKNMLFSTGHPLSLRGLRSYLSTEPTALPAFCSRMYMSVYGASILWPSRSDIHE